MTSPFAPELRAAVRRARRRPALTVAVAGTLALGIGVNATMATVVDRLLFQAPAHVSDAGRVKRILFTEESVLGLETGSLTGYPQLLALRRGVPQFERVAAFEQGIASVGRGVDGVTARVTLVSDDFFELLGAQPAAGRFFVREDHLAPMGASVTVLSTDFWLRQFGGDPQIVGRVIDVDGRQFVVAGIAPRRFTGVVPRAVDLWLPLRARLSREPLDSWEKNTGSRWLAIVARVRAGASTASAEQAATRVIREMDGPAAQAASRPRVLLASIVPGRGPDKPPGVRLSFWLSAVSMLVLLIACANVSNLLTVDALRRRRDTAVRVALGATPGALVSAFVAELLVSVSVAAVLALALLAATYPLAERLLVGSGAVYAPAITARSTAITIAMTLLSAAAVSLVPLVQGRRPNLVLALGGSRAYGDGNRASRARTALVSAQAAFGAVLLIGSGLFATSLQRVTALDLGVALDQTIVASPNVDRLPWSRARRSEFFQEALRRLQTVPGVAHASLAEQSPYMFGRAAAPVPLGQSWETVWAQREVAYVTAVDSGFFETVGAGSLVGRDFVSTDVAGAPRVVIINRPLARLLWPGDQDPLGQCLDLSSGGGCARIVGILNGVWKFSALQRDKMALYVPLAQAAGTAPYPAPHVLFARVPRNADRLLRPIQRALQSVDADVPPIDVAILRDVVEPEFRPWRVGASVMSFFALLALAMTVVGLCGVVAFATVQRRHEIGIRVALGAGAADVMRSVSAPTLLAVAAGLAAGLLVSVAASRWLGSLLFQTSPRDPVVMAGAVAGLLFVAAVAVLATARMALRGDPLDALRAD